MDAEFRVPKPDEILPFTMEDGAEIIVRRHGNPDGKRIILSHGNGFASDAYFPFWQYLLPAYDIFLYDQRNHGWNPPHDLIIHHDVPWFSSDLEEILKKIEKTCGQKPTFGVFHSISAITSIRHALEFGWNWRGLILFDPPLVMPPMHDLHGISQGYDLMLANWAAERQAVFKTPLDLAMQLKNSKSHGRWVAGAHELMARSILKEDKNSNDWKLCCPPGGESRVYATNASMNLTPHFAELAGPLKIIASDPNSLPARSPALVNQALHQLYGHSWQAIPDTTHMLQLEKPELCAQITEDFLENL